MRVDIFADVIKQIRSEKIKEFTILCLKDAPEYLEKIPASTSGKYHPKSSLGEGGLCRHILRACHFANYFLHASGITPEDIRGDIIYSALLLHDIGKKADYKGCYYEYVNHPLTAVEMLKKHKHIIDEKIFSLIKECVKFHMGHFSPESIKKPIFKYNLLELLTYYSDYLSSKRELEVMPMA